VLFGVANQAGKHLLMATVDAVEIPDRQKSAPEWVQ
jgi:hypothetical protein